MGVLQATQCALHRQHGASHANEEAFFDLGDVTKMTNKNGGLFRSHRFWMTVIL